MTLLVSLTVFVAATLAMWWFGKQWRSKQQEQYVMLIVISMLFMLISGYYLNLAVQVLMFGD